MFSSQNRDSGLPRVWYTVTYDYVTVPSVLIGNANDLKDFSSKSLIFSNNSCFFIRLHPEYYSEYD